MTLLEKKINKWLVKAVLGWALISSATRDETKPKWFLERLKDFFKSWLHELHKDTKKVLK